VREFLLSRAAFISQTECVPADACVLLRACLMPPFPDTFIPPPLGGSLPHRPSAFRTPMRCRSSGVREGGGLIGVAQLRTNASAVKGHTPRASCGVAIHCVCFFCPLFGPCSFLLFSTEFCSLVLDGPPAASGNNNGHCPYPLRLHTPLRSRLESRPHEGTVARALEPRPCVSRRPASRRPARSACRAAALTRLHRRWSPRRLPPVAAPRWPVLTTHAAMRPSGLGVR